MTKVYNPKTFFPHAASLGQTFVHCPIFPTAASRRSLDRISVPMWPFNLSVRLPIVGLVGRYPANCLIGRELIPLQLSPLVYPSCDSYTSYGISNCFRLLSLTEGQIAHALLTRPPLGILLCPVRLECVMHAASVHPEPGSNSLNVSISKPDPSGSNTFSNIQSVFCSFTFLTLRFLVFFLTRFTLFSVSLYFSCCSIFNEHTFRRRLFLSPATFLLYHSIPLLSSALLRFFKIFPNFLTHIFIFRPGYAKRLSLRSLSDVLP